MAPQSGAIGQEQEGETMADYPYDVALSFAGEQRPYVHQVAQVLQANGVSVFYDDFEQVDLWGKDLSEFLDQAYRQDARYCVLFLSEAYAQKVWTNHERKSALARALEERDEYVLPARFDDTEIPGIRPTTGYIDLRNMPPAEFAALILEKIGGNSAGIPLKTELAFRIPQVSETDFNPYAAAISVMSQIKNEIQSRCGSLSHLGISVSTFGQDGEHSVRVVAQGETVFSLNMRLDETFGSPAVTFHGVPGAPTGDGNAHNAWATMEQGHGGESTILKLNDLSLLQTFGGETVFTPSQFIEKLWNRICDEIETQNGRRR